MIESVNHVVVSGRLERDPALRYRADGTALCTCTLRLEERGPHGEDFRLYVPVGAYGKLGEALGRCGHGDLLLFNGKLFWRSSPTRTGDVKGSLAVLVQKMSVLLPMDAEVDV
jgi:single-stranded DNA-binding protein